MNLARPDVSAVVFDFDGVLADTERLHLSAFQRVFSERGWTLDEATYFDRYLGCDDRGLVVTFARDRHLELAEEDVRALVLAKTEAFDTGIGTGLVLFPQARPCVERLASHFVLGIASGAAKAEILTILEAGGLRSRFAAIVAADDVSETKPSPEPYVTAARQLGIDPRACLAIEDSTPGLASARAAGMRTIGITTTLPRHELTIADCTVDSLDEVTADLISSLRRER